MFFLTGGWGGTPPPQEYVELRAPTSVDDCQVSTLPDGTLVKSYSQVGVETSTGPWTLYRVDRLVDGVVIGLNASAGPRRGRERAGAQPARDDARSSSTWRPTSSRSGRHGRQPTHQQRRGPVGPRRWLRFRRVAAAAHQPECCRTVHKPV